MIKNDIEEDIRRMCEDKGISKSSLAYSMGMTRQCLYRVLRNGEALTQRKIEIIEALGYDIEIKYVKK